MALLTSLLIGRTQEWTAALYNTKKPACNQYTVFVNQLSKTFVPSSSQVDLESQLLLLRRGDQSICHFVSNFRILTSQLSWGNSALQSVFVEGLAGYIRNEMFGHEAPKTLDATIDLTLKMTNGSDSDLDQTHATLHSGGAASDLSSSSW